MPTCAGSERCEFPCQAEADTRSAHRRAARVCAAERAPDVLRLADGVGRFFKLVFLNSGKDRDRLAVCCQQTTIRTDERSLADRFGFLKRNSVRAVGQKGSSSSDVHS